MKSYKSLKQNNSFSYKLSFFPVLFIILHSSECRVINIACSCQISAIDSANRLRAHMKLHNRKGEVNSWGGRIVLSGGGCGREGMRALCQCSTQAHSVMNIRLIPLFGFPLLVYLFCVSNDGHIIFQKLVWASKLKRRGKF